MTGPRFEEHSSGYRRRHFATGVNDASAGAVLASFHLPDDPLVLLPVRAYGLGQQVFAGLTESALAADRNR